MKPETFANRTLDRCDSTNDLARALGEAGYPSGTWISTRIQEQGRGRLGRKWESIEGNLFLSVVLRVENKSLWTWIPMATAVAVARAIQNALPQYSIPVRIKWPNDLWVNDQKLGGILCEAIGGRGGSFLVSGIGLNCAFAPAGLDQKTTSLSQVAGLRVTADQVRDFVVEGLLETLAHLEKKGTSWLSERFSELAALPSGSLITWGDDAKSEGRIIGLGDSGELIVELGSGERLRLYAEDVKIRRKEA